MQLMQFLTLGFECSLLYFGQAKLQQTPCVFCVAQWVEYFLKLYLQLIFYEVFVQCFEYRIFF